MKAPRSVVVFVRSSSQIYVVRPLSWGQTAAETKSGPDPAKIGKRRWDITQKTGRFL